MPHHCQQPFSSYVPLAAPIATPWACPSSCTTAGFGLCRLFPKCKFIHVECLPMVLGAWQKHAELALYILLATVSYVRNCACARSHPVGALQPARHPPPSRSPWSPTEPSCPAEAHGPGPLSTQAKAAGGTLANSLAPGRARAPCADARRAHNAVKTWVRNLGARSRKVK
jgi:hypothetical protein